MTDLPVYVLLGLVVLGLFGVLGIVWIVRHATGRDFSLRLTGWGVSLNVTSTTPGDHDGS